MTEKGPKYLAFKGGGGKGVCYVGAIKALETLELLPLDVANRVVMLDGDNPLGFVSQVPGQIKGLSGSSAGALTSLCVALGLRAKDVMEELSGEHSYVNEKGESKKTNIMNSFMDWDDVKDVLEEIRSNPKTSYANKYFNTTEAFYFRSVIDQYEWDGAWTDPGWEKIKSKAKKILTDSKLGFLKLKVVEKFIEKLETFIDEMTKEELVNGKTRNNPIGDAILGRHYTETATNRSYMLAWHVWNLYHTGGFFTGTPVRRFFVKFFQKHLFTNEDMVDRMKEYNNTFVDDEIYLTDEGPLQSQEDANAKKMFSELEELWESYRLTFRQFYFLTGCDLRITGTNMSHRIPLEFSKDRTPDFSVLAAAEITMNLPVVFSPVHVTTNVFKSKLEYEFTLNQIGLRPGTPGAPKWESYNNMYKGGYFDGGMLNNLPIHSFDNGDEHPFKLYMDPKNAFKQADVNPEVLGFSLVLDSPEYSYSGWQAGYEEPKVDFQFGVGYVGSVVSTLMYPAEEGQYRTLHERALTVDLPAMKVGTADFAPGHEKRDEPIMHAYWLTMVKLHPAGRQRFYGVGRGLEAKERITTTYRMLNSLLKRNRKSPDNPVFKLDLTVDERIELIKRAGWTDIANPKKEDYAITDDKPSEISDEDWIVANFADLLSLLTTWRYNMKEEVDVMTVKAKK